MRKKVYWNSASNEPRFWKGVIKGSITDCWIWNGSRDRDGYGKFSYGTIPIPAHRFSMMLVLNRELSFDEKVLHDCDNPPCVNPMHLFIGTPLDNTHDMISKGRFGKETGVKGEGHYRAKITAEQALEIRSLYQTKAMKTGDIAAMFGISGWMVRHIGIGLGWKHI